MIRVAAIFVVLLMVASSGWAQAAVTQQAASKPQSQDVFRQSLQELVAYSPDPCGPPFGNENNWHTSAIESRLFDAAQGIVADALNDSAAPQAPKDRASAALKRLEDESARVNTGWPEENRFSGMLLRVFDGLRMTPFEYTKAGSRAMPACTKCGKETELHVHGVPICLECERTAFKTVMDETTPQESKSDEPEQKK